MVICPQMSQDSELISFFIYSGSELAAWWVSTKFPTAFHPTGKGGGSASVFLLLNCFQMGIHRLSIPFVNKSSSDSLGLDSEKEILSSDMTVGNGRAEYELAL